MKRKKKINRDIDAVIVATYRKTKKSKNPDHWYYVNLYVFSLLVYFEKNERKVVFLFIDQNYNRTEILLDTEEDCIEMFEVVKKTLKKLLTRKTNNTKLHYENECFFICHIFDVSGYNCIIWTARCSYKHNRRIAGCIGDAGC